MKSIRRHFATACVWLCILISPFLIAAPAIANALAEKRAAASPSPALARTNSLDLDTLARIGASLRPAGATAPASGKKTYIVALKDPAQMPAREELRQGRSPVTDYLRQHNLTVSGDNQLHFLNMFVIDLDDTEYAAFFNREWTGTEIQDASGRALHRHARQTGKALTKAEIDALHHPAKGTRAVHSFQNLIAIEEDSATVGLCAVWPTNFPSRPSGNPFPNQIVGVGLQRMNVG